MPLKIETTNQPVQSLNADWLVVGVWENNSPPFADDALTDLAAQVAQLCESGDFDGRQNETLPIYQPTGVAAKRVLLVGLGKPENGSAMSISRATGTAIRTIAKKKYDRVACLQLAAASPNLSPEEATAAIVAGAQIAEAGQDIYRGKKSRKPIETLILPFPASSEAIEKGRIAGEATRLAAELVNLTPQDIFPESFCQRAKELAAPHNIQVEVLDAKALAKENMNCILGVGRGSSNEPRLLILHYNGAPNDDRKFAWVGKGITFDSGGLSIKTADGMTTMKCDMAGAAAVLAATVAVAERKLPINILCLTPLAENMPGGRSIKPGDVLKAKNGKTIEVLNTDAEGRLVLADALSHAVDLGATHIIDLATLTGACMVALGNAVAGVMTNNDAWAQCVLDAAKHAGERAWPLPMFEEYDELIKSGVADMKNIGGKWGGAITAAKLLAFFVGDTPWVHVDLAGPAFAEKESPYQDAGGTGYFVRSLITLAETLGQK